MSCLSLDELSLSEQAAVADSFTAACERKFAALRSSLWLSPVSPALPPVAGGEAPSLASAPGGSHIPLHHTEDASMLQSKVTDHPPLQVCYRGHVPAMFLSSGNSEQLFHVECALCKVRTPKFRAKQTAADAWTARDVMPLNAHSTLVAA